MNDNIGISGRIKQVESVFWLGNGIAEQVWYEYFFDKIGVNPNCWGYSKPGAMGPLNILRNILFLNSTLFQKRNPSGKLYPCTRWDASPRDNKLFSLG